MEEGWPEGVEMDECWRTLQIFLPSSLSRSEVARELHTRVISAASDGGEFVGRIRIGDSEQHSDGWLLWQPSYQSGPPRAPKFR